MRVFADARVAVHRDDTLRWMIGYYESGIYRHAHAKEASFVLSEEAS